MKSLSSAELKRFLMILANKWPIFIIPVIFEFLLSWGLLAVCPATIPAVQEWQDGAGVFSFRPSSKLIVDTSAADLKDSAILFEEELFLQSGLILPLTEGETALAGDVFFTKNGNDSAHGKEAYIVEINDKVIIRANDSSGAFYATRTILQWLRYGMTIPCGRARDWPVYRERGFLVDLGRKYFSTSWLKRHIKELAYFKYNMLQLSFSDFYGFRLESETHPEITSKQYYTKNEIRELIDLAKEYHIEIVPLIDMPAHMTAILDAHHDLRLSDLPQYCDKIDLSNEASYTIMQEIVEEYIPLFSSQYWHFGGDEYLSSEEYVLFPRLEQYARQKYGANASGKDVYLGFANRMNSLLKSKGKISRAWNDGLFGGTAVSVDTDIVLELWDGYMGRPSAQTLVDSGHSIMNCNGRVLYYVLGGPKPDPEKIYEEFNIYEFYGLGSVDPLKQHLLGAKLHVWCDTVNAETEEQIQTGIGPSIRSLSQINWGSAKVYPSYANFQLLFSTIDHAPGFNQDSGKNKQTLNITSGWNWVSFNILPNDRSLSGVFTGILDQIEQVKSQTASAIYENNTWRGDLTDMSGIANGLMYKVKVKANCRLMVTGAADLSATSISLSGGWNWVAFYPQAAMPISRALTSITGPALQVKSQTESALYLNNTWIGDLTRLEPGKGYVILMSAPGTLTFPASLTSW